MMPPHLSILITPSEMGDSERREGGWVGGWSGLGRGREKKVTEEGRERDREKHGNSSKRGLCSPS